MAQRLNLIIFSVAFFKSSLRELIYKLRNLFFLIFELRISFLNKLHLRIFNVSAFLQIPISDFNTPFNIAIDIQFQ